MIHTIASAQLPVDETLKIQKYRLQAEKEDSGRRISIVTGIHGDELEGQYVCYELIRRIREKKEFLTGTVDIYPALNPLGIDSVTRGIPAFDLDMNRIFPGNSDGSMIEALASDIIKDLSGSDLCLDIHASNIYLTEVPQIRINELHKETLVPYAGKANVDFIWVHGANTVLESTLAYSLNSIGTPTLVVEMGVGMRITREYGNQLTDGIMNLMRELGIWQGETSAPVQPVVSENSEEVVFLNAAQPGIFVKECSHGCRVKKGQLIGVILNPLEGVIREKICSPADGFLFTIREYPVVDEGSLLARILTGGEQS